VSMNELSERRLAENELLFRHHNNKQKNRQQRESSADESELFVDFYCECSNRRCHERIPISVKEYERDHEDNKQFIALPGHENRAIEEVIKKRGFFNVIQKYMDPAEVVG
jgi:hypothetical protein